MHRGKRTRQARELVSGKLEARAAIGTRELLVEGNTAVDCAIGDVHRVAGEAIGGEQEALRAQHTLVVPGIGVFGQTVADDEGRGHWGWCRCEGACG